MEATALLEGKGLKAIQTIIGKARDMLQVINSIAKGIRAISGRPEVDRHSHSRRPDEGVVRATTSRMLPGYFIMVVDPISAALAKIGEAIVRRPIECDLSAIGIHAEADYMTGGVNRLRNRLRAARRSDIDHPS